MICGAKDGFWPLEMFAETAYRMPHGRLIMYPELGHSLVTSSRFVADVAAAEGLPLTIGKVLAERACSHPPRAHDVLQQPAMLVEE